MKLTEEQLQALFPYASHKKVALFLPFFNETIEKFQINTKLRLAAFCAQLEIESGSLYYVEEIADGTAYENRRDLGNLEREAIAIAHAQGTTTGKMFKGHGLIQITGYYNHKKCGEAFGIDTINNPEILTEPKYACLSAGWFWNTHNCNALADAELFGAITKVINGGYNHAKERLAAYARNKKFLLTENMG